MNDINFNNQLNNFSHEILKNISYNEDIEIIPLQIKTLLERLGTKIWTKTSNQQICVKLFPKPYIKDVWNYEL